jgi:hypothetical protein
MEFFLQEKMQAGLTRAQERVEILKMDVKKTITFHSYGQKELETPTKNINFEIWCNTKNHLPKQAFVITKLEPSQKLIWNPTRKRNFSTKKLFFN